MKKRALCICAFVAYALVICFMLATKIEAEMRTQVFIQPIIIPKKPTGLYNLPLDVLFESRPDIDMFEVCAGTGWKEGLCISLVDGNSYSINPATDTVCIASGKDRQIIRHASRSPRVGSTAEIVEQIPMEDQYLIIYKTDVPDFENHWEGVSLTAETGNVRLLTVANSPQPFLEDQAQEMLYQIQSDSWWIYSLNAVEQFLNNLPKLALLAGILWTMIILWLHNCFLIGHSQKYYWCLVVNITVELLLMLALFLLLSQVDLPASLLPENNIFDWLYYTLESNTIFDALNTLGMFVQPLLVLKDFTNAMTEKILLCVTMLPLTWVLFVHWRKNA